MANNGGAKILGHSRVPDSKNQPRPSSLNILHRRGRHAEAQWDITCLCVARVKDEVDFAGSGRPMATHVGQMMGGLMDEPERMGQVILGLLGMVVRLSDGNAALQGRPGGFLELVTHLVDAADTESGGYKG